jgi:hypothetical protein
MDIAVQLCTAQKRKAWQTIAVPTNSQSIVGILNELGDQGLLIKSHNARNGTWFIKGDGIFLGYIATTDELIGLKEENRLDLNGIKSLG